MSDESLYSTFLGLYSLAWAPASPVIGAVLAMRRDCRARWRELLAMGVRVPPETTAPKVWLHAVSVGELVSAIPVVEQLRERWPGLSVRLTGTIEDVFAMAQAQGFARDWEGFLSLDVPSACRALSRAIDPDLVLISETDLWPNMLETLHAMRRPVFLINGRISYKIARGFGLLPRIARVMLSRVKAYLVQTAQDRERLLALGVAPECIEVTGNTKHEAALRASPPGRPDAIIAPIKAARRPVILGGSTHPGEEETLLALSRLEPARPLVLLAPRLVARGESIAREARARGLVVRRLSEGIPGAAELRTIDGLVIDELGVLGRLYGIAAAAFVGGSFDGSGGHNFLEAAAAGCPVVVGPSMRNFHEEVERFLREGALVQAARLEDVTSEITGWLSDPARAKELGARGEALLRASQGAARRTVEAIIARQAPRGAGR